MRHIGLVALGILFVFLIGIVRMRMAHTEPLSPGLDRAVQLIKDTTVEGYYALSENPSRLDLQTAIDSTIAALAPGTPRCYPNPDTSAKFAANIKNALVAAFRSARSSPTLYSRAFRDSMGEAALLALQMESIIDGKPGLQVTTSSSGVQEVRLDPTTQSALLTGLLTACMEYNSMGTSDEPLKSLIGDALINLNRHYLGGTSDTFMSIAATLTQPPAADDARISSILARNIERSIPVSLVGDLVTISLYTTEKTWVCPNGCVVSDWSAWYPCSAACGGGTSKRVRRVLREATEGGPGCPVLEETRPCNTQQCETDCTVSDWLGWSTCSAPCGGGLQQRERRPIQQPSPGGKPCPHLVETRECNTAPCAGDCVMSDWSAYSTCTATCGGGTQTRTRSIVSPPTNNGAPCGALTETTACNTQPCSTDCVMSDWTPWSPCTASCGPGFKVRGRSIITQPTGTGAPCGPTDERALCNDRDCLAVGAAVKWSCPVRTGSYPDVFANNLVNGPLVFGGRITELTPDGMAKVMFNVVVATASSIGIPQPTFRDAPYLNYMNPTPTTAELDAFNAKYLGTATARPTYFAALNIPASLPQSDLTITTEELYGGGIRVGDSVRLDFVVTTGYTTPLLVSFGQTIGFEGRVMSIAANNRVNVMWMVVKNQANQSIQRKTSTSGDPNWQTWNSTYFGTSIVRPTAYASLFSIYPADGIPMCVLTHCSHRESRFSAWEQCSVLPELPPP